ncbi:uncharacterized protein PHALS_13349 [Plasmopara halstedii]|uniref:Uncharacterized protein n=1 Tax=Plasmopara halstedii TaxID=4781 RepID=A0A0P1APF4_PLAHL|nr:uncharacterized protein PHALS_13349 [Plasmopara halstedii]CEG43132.1 hypothetical protein PHALS_13349 [Plasmopara halstedii]|eukprot:XP_024579501.1 hypothetical protein PHALS_13349 [Plasmopara halstedii]
MSLGASMNKKPTTEKPGHLPDCNSGMQLLASRLEHIKPLSSTKAVVALWYRNIYMLIRAAMSVWSY